MSLAGNELIILRFELKDAGASSLAIPPEDVMSQKNSAATSCFSSRRMANYAFIYVDFIHAPNIADDPWNFTSGLEITLRFTFVFLLQRTCRKLTMIARMKTRIIARRKWSTAARKKFSMGEEYILLYLVFSRDIVVCYILIGSERNN